MLRDYPVPTVCATALPRMSNLFFGPRERKRLLPAVSGHVQKSVSRIRSMEFVLTDRLEDRELRKLRKLAPVDLEHRPRAKAWPYELTLFSPNGSVLSALSRADAVVFPKAFTASLELSTSTFGEADDLVRFFAHHFLPVPAPSRALEIDGESIRFSGTDRFPKTELEIAVSSVMGSNRPERSPCCRVDVRVIQRGDPFRWLEIVQQSWWANGLELYEVPTPRTIGSVWAASTGRGESQGIDALGRRVLRVASSPLDGLPSVWNLACFAAARRVAMPDLVKIENSWLLPGVAD